MFRVILLHNIITPYRLPLFQRLSKQVDLHVFFCKSKITGRLWPASLKNYSFKGEALRNITLPIGGLVINPSLVFRLLTNPCDVYIVGENSENILSILTTLFIAKIFGRPFIVWSGVVETNYVSHSGMSFLWKIGKAIVEGYRKFLYRFTDSFIAYGKAAKRYLTKKGVSGDKIYIGTQVISKHGIKRVSVSKEDVGFKDKKIILFLGYLVKRKGIEYLIKAFKQMDRRDTVLIIAGAGREEKRLKSLAGNREDILFPGYVTGREKAKYYSIADIFVIPTLHDPWPQVINEAMAYGLPIITTDRDGSSEELIKGNGFIVNAKNIKQFINVLKILLNDDELREKMGKRSREIIKHFDLNYAVEAFIKAINFAIKHSLD